MGPKKEPQPFKPYMEAQTSFYLNIGGTKGRRGSGEIFLVF